MSLVINDICIHGSRLVAISPSAIPWRFDRWLSDVVEFALAFQEGVGVARSCEVCGKGPVHGRQISHAHNVSSRLWYPNVQRLKVIVGKTRLRMRVCTRCLRSNKVVKATARPARTAS
jgi:large subunit ribosomal protein L28